jgi:coenzyme F420-reducing hydrogenase delta subunit
MKEVDDLDLKAEIERISKKIDEIVQQVEKLDPVRKEKQEQERE